MVLLEWVFMLQWTWGRFVSLAEEKPESPSGNMAFWFYNVTNLVDVKAGTLPSVSVQGPYLYDTYSYFHSVAFSEDGSDVSFVPHTRWVFNQESSIGSEADVMSAPNPSYIDLASENGFSQSQSLQAACGTDSGCRADILSSGTVYATRTVTEWLWDYNDPIQKAVSGDGAHANIMGCAGDRDVEASVEFCNMTDVQTPSSLYTGSDDVGKWLAMKDDDEELNGMGTQAVALPVLMAADGGWIFPADEGVFSFYQSAVGRVLPMELLEDEVVYSLPLHRFIVGATVLQVDPATNTFQAGLFNHTVDGPFMQRWASSCGYESGKSGEQVSAFVAGHVTGYPACDFYADALHVDIDKYTGLNWQGVQNTEMSVIVSNMEDGEYESPSSFPLESKGGQYVGSSGKYMLVPTLRSGPLKNMLAEGTGMFIGDFTVTLHNTVHTMNVYMRIWWIIALILMVIGMIMTVAIK